MTPTHLISLLMRTAADLIKSRHIPPRFLDMTEDTLHLSEVHMREAENRACMWMITKEAGATGGR